MDATAWGAIGGGLSALSEGLTAMQLRKLAKQREDEERERQKEEAALRKAQLKAQEFQSMDTRNFKKVSENGQVTNKANANALLNAAAFGRGGEQVKGDISGDTYFRGAGESPFDQKNELEAERLKNALEKVTLANQRALEIQRLKNEGDLTEKGTLGADTKYRVDGQKTIAASRPKPVGRGGPAAPKDRTAMIMQYAKQLAAPHFNRETMEEEAGLPWEQAVEQAKVLVDKAAGGNAAGAQGGLRKATDDEFRQGMKESGNDPVKMRAWLKQRGLTE